MRIKSEKSFQFTLFENEESLPKVLRQYRAEYRRINEIIAKIPEIVNIAHNDFANLNASSKGRSSSFSSDSLFRALIIKQKEGIDYREACIRISESEFLQDFCMFSRKSSIDYTLICKAFNAMTPETWELINQLLCYHGIENAETYIKIMTKKTRLLPLLMNSERFCRR